MTKKHPKTLKQLENQRNRAFKRFPLLFVLLGTFGVISIYYGLQKIFEETPLLASNPIIAVIAGLIILLFTGTLYKKLG